MISDADVEKALDFLREFAQQAGEARAAREYMDEYRHVIKSKIMREHPTESVAAQQAIAYADPRYALHLDAMKIAIEQDEFLRWKRSAAEAKIQAWQTMSANNRKGVM